ncbi:MAG: hypothetical protein HAW59_05060 [Betaproteobacteria bacterium]|nr:hypothetical protein [Betaproteobacteria bacterium]
MMAKSIFKGYCLAIVGLVFGIVGLHRFYYGFFTTGLLMLTVFFSGVCCFAVGYVHLLTPFLTMLVANGGDLSALPALPAGGLLDLKSKGWFIAGMILCAASLCWLAVDCLFMPDLARKANRR